MKQKGFTALELLLILAVLLALAGVGSYFYTKHQQAADKPIPPNSTGTLNNDRNSTSPNGIPGGANGSTAGPQTAAGTTVKVPEAGFQITVPNSMKDLTYHADGSVVTFSTASLTAAAPTCTANNGAGGAFDTVFKGYGKYQPPSNPADGGLLKQYDTYYFAYTLPKGPCAKGLSPANQSLYDDQAQTFYTALKTVVSL